MAINFLSKDGYLNIEEFTALAREIDKLATKEGLKPGIIHYAPKVMPKFDTAKAKANPDLFTRKRAQIIKERTRMPAAGSRMKMVIILREYKGLEEFSDFTADINAAKKAIVAHNKLAERTVASIKKEGAKKREVAAKEFDKNLDCFMEDVLKDGDGNFIDGVDVAVGTSMMGKTLIIKLPNGGYVSVGKADKERFLKAQESENGDDEKPARGRVARGAKPAAKSGTRSAAKPALKQKAAADKPLTRAERRAARLAKEAPAAKKPAAKKTVAARNIKKPAAKIGRTSTRR